MPVKRIASDKQNNPKYTWETSSERSTMTVVSNKSGDQHGTNLRNRSSVATMPAVVPSSNVIGSTFGQDDYMCDFLKSYAETFEQDFPGFDSIFDAGSFTKKRCNPTDGIDSDKILIHSMEDRSEAEVEGLVTSIVKRMEMNEERVIIGKINLYCKSHVSPTPYVYESFFAALKVLLEDILRMCEICSCELICSRTAGNSSMNCFTLCLSSKDSSSSLHSALQSALNGVERITQKFF